MAIPYSRTLFGGLPWYSALMVLGILVAVWLGTREEKRLGLPKDTMIDLTLVAVPCGIVGARLYYVAMTWEVFSQNPISILYVWEGGVAIYGAVIGGALGAYVYAKIKKRSFLALLDITAPGLLLAQAIGRWGNYFNMEAYGAPILNPMFQFFPAGVLIASGGVWTWHMATFFYESLWNVCGFVALWLMRKHQRQAGNTFCWYLLIYGSGRFIIEQLREDSLWLGGLRVSQMLSLVLCAVAAAVLLYRAAQDRRGWFALACVVAVMLIARWMFLSSAWVYGALMAVAAVSGVWLCRSNRTAAWLLAAAIVLDAAGLVSSIMGFPFSLSFSMRLHTLLCSVTLPIYIGALCASQGTKPHEG